MITIPIIVTPWLTKLLIVITVVGTALLIGYILPITISSYYEKKRKRREDEIAKIANDVCVKAMKEKKIVEKTMEDKCSPWGLNLS